MSMPRLMKMQGPFLGLILSILPVAKSAEFAAPAAADMPKTRIFLFTYGVTVTGVPAGETARIWLPVPPSTKDQDSRIVSKHLPGEHRIGRETKFGNQILYIEAKPGPDGKIPIAVTYRVTRHEVMGSQEDDGTKADELALYLQPDAKVPVGGKPLELIKDKKLPEDPMAMARALYDVVNQHMRYSKEGTGWGQGDSVWACESGYGNCSDFHSLFTSLARAQKIPCKFEIGFPLPAQRGSGDITSYHCWAKFYLPGRGWTPVDISEANKDPKMRDYYFGNLTADRVAFSTGRDLELEPRQAGKPLNFFVFPYVEVEGKAYPAEKVLRKFSYKDISADQGK
jgi:transglutaminase-like putative cysteine protease